MIIEKLLNETLEILNSKGASQAYDYLLEHKNTPTGENQSQMYNFLYCLAAMAGKAEESLAFLEEAILIKGYWYRPAVFKDEDLECLFGNERFDACVNASELKYRKVLEVAKTEMTWTEKNKDQVLLALHGNQENMKSCKKHWCFAEKHGYQVEYIQSEELDSYDLFRWETEGSGSEQLQNVCHAMNWNDYSSRVLAGFSSGCNVILRALSESELTCETIILQSPWIPSIHESLSTILEAIKRKKIKVIMLCGRDDEDSVPLVELFDSQGFEREIDLKTIWIDGLAHDFPENFEDRVLSFL